MHPGQITPSLLKEFGGYHIVPVRVGTTKLDIVNFPITPSRANLAREFATAGVLRNAAARDLYTKALETAGHRNKIEWDVWQTIGEAEGLPEFEPIPPDVEQRIQDARNGADFRNLAFNQATVDALISGLTRLRDTDVRGKQPNAFITYSGAPGTSKSKVCRVMAAVVGRPIYTFNAEAT